MFREQELANIALSLEQREDYLALWAKQPYFSVLQGVLALADRTRLEGCMWALRTPGSEVRSLQRSVGIRILITSTASCNCARPFPPSRPFKRQSRRPTNDDLWSFRTQAGEERL
jgi:hypothetical protein